MVEAFFERKDHFVADIVSEIEMLHELGKLFIARVAVHPQRSESRGGRWPLATRGDGDVTIGAQTTDPLDGSVRTMDEAEFPEDDDDDTDCGEGPDNADDLFERTAETLSYCFVEFCWANRRFDPTAFGEFTKMFFDENGFASCLAKDQKDC